MEITESELTAQYQQANPKWPFIHQTELAHGLPRMLLRRSVAHGAGWQMGGL
jgi:hypothetical protein